MKMYDIKSAYPWELIYGNQPKMTIWQRIKQKFASLLKKSGV